MKCDKCGSPVIHAVLKQFGPGVEGNRTIVLDAEPNPDKGTVILAGNECRYVSGPDDWKLVRQYGIPVFTRHNIYCREYYPRMVN